MQIRSLWNPLVYLVMMLNVLQVYFIMLGFHMFIEKDCCILTVRETTMGLLIVWQKMHYAYQIFKYGWKMSHLILV